MNSIFTITKDKKILNELMKVKELVKILIKFDPEANIYYRIDPTIHTQYPIVEFVEEGPTMIAGIIKGADVKK